MLAINLIVKKRFIYYGGLQIHGVLSSRAYGKKQDSEKLSEKEVELLMNSIKEVEGKAECYGTEFFRTLFKSHPTYSQFFKKWGKNPEELLYNKSFIKEHAAGNVIKTLVALVKDVKDSCKAEENAVKLGHKHVDYCVKQKHFKDAKKALMTTIETNMEDKWSCEMGTAWKKALKIIFNGLYKGLEAK